MGILFENYISKQITKDRTNILNILNNKNNNKSNLISNQDLLELNLQGLNKYNNNLISYISKWNNKNLILNIKKDSLFKLDSNILPINNNINLNNINLNNISQNKINNNLLKEINYISKKERISNYLDSIIFNNSINKKNFTYAQEINYKFINKKNKIIKEIYTFLFYSFLSMKSLISRPIFEITNEKIIIHLFFYLFKENNKININKNKTFIKLNNIKLNIICKILSKIFNKPIELDLVRLYYPYFDSNIFVNLLQILINKMQVRIIMQNFFKKAIIKDPIKIKREKINSKIPSFLSGINLKIGGRLLTQRLVPKQTIKIIRKGTLAKAKINYLDRARYTNKNKRGAFSLTISIGHYLT
jgi:hypothetical protein